MKKIKFFSSYCSDDQIYQNIISSWGRGNATYKDIKITKDSDYEYAVILNRAVPDRYLPKENILGFSHEPRETAGLDLNNLNFISNNVSDYYISNNSGFAESFKEGFCYVCPADFGKSEGVDYSHNKKMSMILSLSRFMPGHHHHNHNHFRCYYHHPHHHHHHHNYHHHLNHHHHHHHYHHLTCDV